MRGEESRTEPREMKVRKRDGDKSDIDCKNKVRKKSVRKIEKIEKGKRKEWERKE